MKKLVLVSPYVFDRIRTAIGDKGVQGFVNITTPSGAEVISMKGMTDDKILCVDVTREIDLNNDFFRNLYSVL